MRLNLDGLLLLVFFACLALAWLFPSKADKFADIGFLALVVFAWRCMVHSLAKALSGLGFGCSCRNRGRR